MERRRLLPEQFLKYVTKPVSREDVNLWVKVNSIGIEKVNLFGEYLTFLYDLIIDTYLGKDTIKTDNEIEGHFNWCWEKIINNFRKENIIFKNEGKHKEYFFNFFYESFYKGKEEQIEKIESFLNVLFVLYTTKTKSELDMLLEMYNLLNDNLTVKE
tara:strand:- start:94 stop:564 length:471 start_codon:yes stop_codon:yes gene_type:complete